MGPNIRGPKEGRGKAVGEASSFLFTSEHTYTGLLLVFSLIVAHSAQAVFPDETFRYRRVSQGVTRDRQSAPSKRSNFHRGSSSAAGESAR